MTGSFERLATETDIVGYPILPLVRQLAAATPGDDGRYIHWGATTQDIMDCASVLQMREGLQILRHQLDELLGILERLSDAHRDTYVWPDGIDTL